MGKEKLQFGAVIITQERYGRKDNIDPVGLINALSESLPYPTESRQVLDQVASELFFRRAEWPDACFLANEIGARVAERGDHITAAACYAYAFEEDVTFGSNRHIYAQNYTIEVITVVEKKDKSPEEVEWLNNQAPLLRQVQEFAIWMKNYFIYKAASDSLSPERRTQLVEANYDILTTTKILQDAEHRSTLLLQALPN